MRRFVIITICLAALLTGCEQTASKIDVFESRRELTGVIERGHSELSVQHIKMMENDIEGLKAEVERSKANAVEAINKANEASQKAIAEEQARLRELQSLREYVSIFVPEQAAKVIELTTKGIDTKINTLDALTQEIKGDVKASTVRMNSTESKLVNVDNIIAEVNRDIRAVDTGVKAASVIAEMNKDNTDKLEENLGDRTKEGIVAILAAATGGGALAKTGKSRAYKEIIDLESKIAALSAVRGSVTGATDSQSGTGTPKNNIIIS